MHRLRVINEYLFERKSKRRAGGPVLFALPGASMDDGAPDKGGELALVGTAQLVAPSCRRRSSIDRWVVRVAIHVQVKKHSLCLVDRPFEPLLSLLRPSVAFSSLVELSWNQFPSSSRLASFQFYERRIDSDNC
jgi:hypothetical protein